MTDNQAAWHKFVLGGASCMSAATVTNPIDVIKIRLQMQGEGARAAERVYKGMFRGMGTIVKQEGIAGLYKGLTPSLMREGSYSSIRIGAYDLVKVYLGAEDPAHTPLWKKIVAGATAGAFGSAIATPTDLVKVRFQAEAALSPGQAPRYPSTLAAFRDIYRNEGGLRGLYKGVTPTTQRAALLTATQLPSYDHFKHWVLNHGWMSEGFPLHVTASMVAGFNCAVITSPVDVVKTRVMKQPIAPDGTPTLYRNTADAFVKIMRSEGLTGFYKGFLPNYLRIGPHTLITFVIYEQLRKLANINPV